MTSKISNDQKIIDRDQIFVGSQNIPLTKQRILKIAFEPRIWVTYAIMDDGGDKKYQLTSQDEELTPKDIMDITQLKLKVESKSKSENWIQYVLIHTEDTN